MTQQYTFYVNGTQRCEHVNGETREAARRDAAFLLNTDESNLVELPQLFPLGQCYLAADGETVIESVPAAQAESGDVEDARGIQVLAQMARTRIIELEGGMIAPQELAADGQGWVYCYYGDGSPVQVVLNEAGLAECCMWTGIERATLALPSAQLRSVGQGREVEGGLR